MMLSRKSLSVFLLLVLCSVNLFAIEEKIIEGKVKVFIKNDDTIYTSKKFIVVVELISNAFLINNPKITFPTSEKYIVQAPEKATYLGEDAVDGMEHYEYEVYALGAGKIKIPPVSASFVASMGYLKPKKEFDIQSEPYYFDVKSPEGIENNSFVLLTDHYTLQSQIKPEKQKLIVGDAVELSITQKAHDVPDILLQPITYQSNVFLRVHDEEPKLKSGLNGTCDVSRTDSFTFVASKEGNVTLPEQKSVWWNSVTKKVQVEIIPAISFEILPDPKIAIDAKKAEQKHRLIYLIVTLFLLVLLYILFASKVRAYIRERKRVYVVSEEGRFKMLLESCQKDNITKVYHHFYYWLELASPQLSSAGFKGIVALQPSFSKALYELEEVLSREEQVFDKTSFMHELKKLRIFLLAAEERSEEYLPKDINPTMS